jgi:hypothetical protein
MQSSPAALCFLPVRSKYSPQHLVLKHPQSVLPLVRQKFHNCTKQLVKLRFCTFNL